MTMLSPGASYHAELREQLESVGRALAAQRGLVWMSRGLVAGAAAMLGLVIWAWTREAVGTLAIPLLVGIPIGVALLTAVCSLFIRQNSVELARRIDRAAGLQERSMTALELGGRGAAFPLAVAQMRDAVEHLKRVDMLEAFPMRAPRNELLAAFFIVVVAAIVGISPNPWLLRARASNPAITIAREQAQRVQRLADSIQTDNSAELDALRQLVSKGARTLEARSNEPDAALNSLQDLEEQVQQMSGGDDQLAAALAAIASALAGDPTTQALADAINTGDMRQISQASKDLAKAVAHLTPQERQRVSVVLRDAANRAGRVSQGVSSSMSSAADHLAAAAAAAEAGQDGQQGDAQAQAASDALNQMGNSAAAADARQRASSQLESSRNALERALGRTQSRSGSNGNNSNSSNSNRSASNGQGENGQSGGQPSDSSQGQSANQNGDGMGPNGSGSQSGDSNSGDNGQGGGSSSGGRGRGMDGGANSGIDAIFRPQQVQGANGAPLNESSQNPYGTAPGGGSVQSEPQSVQPNYSSKPTQGNDSGSIPLGLRDLVKDYFSSLDQK